MSSKRKASSNQIENYFKKAKQEAQADAEAATASVQANIKREKVDVDTAVEGTSKKLGRNRDRDIKILKKFDLNHKFGPCYGVERLERWEWAHSRELHPPEIVKELILENPKDPDYVQGIWYTYRFVMSPIPPNKDPEDANQAVSNGNQQIEAEETEVGEEGTYQLLSQNPNAPGENGGNGHHHVESHDQDEDDDEDDDDDDEDDDEPPPIDAETGFELLASSRAGNSGNAAQSSGGSQVKYDNSNLFEVDYFQQKNQLECEDIVLDENKSQEINKIMSNFQLPERCIPDWAKLVPENVWKKNLLDTLNAKKTDLFDSMPPPSDDSK